MYGSAPYVTSHYTLISTNMKLFRRWPDIPSLINVVLLKSGAAIFAPCLFIIHWSYGCSICREEEVSCVLPRVCAHMHNHIHTVQIYSTGSWELSASCCRHLLSRLDRATSDVTRVCLNSCLSVILFGRSVVVWRSACCTCWTNVPNLFQHSQQATEMLGVISF